MIGNGLSAANVSSRHFIGHIFVDDARFEGVAGVVAKLKQFLQGIMNDIGLIGANSTGGLDLGWHWTLNAEWIGLLLIDGGRLVNRAKWLVHVAGLRRTEGLWIDIAGLRRIEGLLVNISRLKRIERLIAVWCCHLAIWHSDWWALDRWNLIGIKRIYAEWVSICCVHRRVWIKTKRSLRIIG